MQQNNFCQWQYNQAKRRLAVLLPSKNTVFTTLTDKHIAYDGFEASPCSLADFEHYNVFIQLLLTCGFEQDSAEVLAYSAVATQHFLLPNQPKGWFFEPCATDIISQPTLANVKVKYTEQWATVLVTNVDGTVANCLWLETDLNIPGLTLSFGEPFRIFIDRLQAVSLTISYHHYQQSA